jgi:hypothetical protein
MSDVERQELGILAKVVIVIAIILVVSGVLWYGVTFTTIGRVLRQLAQRPGGPMSFRFILQPTMAAIAAIHDARIDARLGRAPYMWTVLHSPPERIGRLREAANATARIVLLGLVMDTIYQVIVLQRFHPVEAVIIALLLALVPYVVLRGLMLRVARRWRRRSSVPRV